MQTWQATPIAMVKTLNLKNKQLPAIVLTTSRGWNENGKLRASVEQTKTKKKKKKKQPNNFQGVLCEELNSCVCHKKVFYIFNYSIKKKHSIYHDYRFQHTIPGVLRAFTLLWNRFPELFHLAELKFCNTNSNFPSSSHWQPPFYFQTEKFSF
jgi:hypothetical protein